MLNIVPAKMVANVIMSQENVNASQDGKVIIVKFPVPKERMALIAHNIANVKIMGNADPTMDHVNVCQAGLAQDVLKFALKDITEITA